MTVALSVAIQHSPARAALAAALVAALDDRCVELATDPDPPPPGTPPTDPGWSPWRTYRYALDTTPPWATHRLILQDDALVCPRFVQAARLALAARPDRVVTFYVGGNARLAAARVTHAAGRGDCWTEVPQFSWVPVVALAWPARLTGQVGPWVDRQRWPRVFRADDEIVGRFLRHAGESLCATVPSLVDHPDDVPSLIGTRARGGRDRGRVAACWIGDECDATAVDW